MSTSNYSQSPSDEPSTIGAGAAWPLSFRFACGFRRHLIIVMCLGLGLLVTCRPCLAGDTLYRVFVSAASYTCTGYTSGVSATVKKTADDTPVNNVAVSFTVEPVGADGASGDSVR